MARAVAKGLAYLGLGAFAVMTTYPIVWLVMSSFKTTQAFQLDRLGLPRRWMVDNYVQAWRIGQFDVLMGNSLLYTAVSTAAIVVLSVAAGFAFAKLRSRATPLLYGGFVIGILLTIQSIMVPLFLMATRTHLYNTRLGVLMVYTAMGLPMGVYLCTEYIKGLPDSVIESARLDGAGYLTILWRIVFPMVRPVVTTLAIVTIPGVWNEFMLINVLVSDNALKSLPVGILRFSGALSSDYGKQFAGLVIGMLPMVVFYLLLRNQLTKGVVAGAVKG
ncbi:carbohydrate ABC transporter permease [Geochorda subterranea]|uniref:Carbohydrate ABC transporter permease n=1 Tax=Geochorda subterranea TaxID=3109564 RepID=A0ABZ1BM68_9FIRM|nr:carbohydrate ABC transporter permease [Limnochorda sp. LNt]WRP13819.1 carbohydrate ABC transporter permease [Limnochorda sp. LNt]